MIHLTNTITSLLPKLEKEGFKGVRFDQLDLEEQLWSDAKADGYTKQQFEQRLRDYVCFIAQPRIRDHWHEPQNDYIDITVNQTGFLMDFTTFLRKTLGEDVHIRYSGGCFEYECYRTTKE